MGPEIRSYRNTDAVAICRVFNSHYQVLGLSYLLTPLSLELCVLAKPYFAPSQLMVAEQAGQCVGFLQLGHEPESLLMDLSAKRVVVSALCVEPQEDEDLIAARLLQAAVDRAVEQRAEQLRFCPPPPATPFFVGLAPGDCMIGAPQIDHRQARWLAVSGWTATESVALWEVDLGRFHAPMDRMQIQIRRMAQVNRLIDEPMLPWYVANMLGHTEQIGFQLSSRGTQSVTAEIVLWMIGHELLPHSDLVARLWPLDPAQCESSEHHYIFLLSEAFRQLREDRVDLVRTVAKEGSQALTRTLERVGFEKLFDGTVYAKSVDL